MSCNTDVANGSPGLSKAAGITTWLHIVTLGRAVCHKLLPK